MGKASFVNDVVTVFCFCVSLYLLLFLPRDSFLRGIRESRVQNHLSSSVNFWVVGTYQIHRVIRWIYIGILFDFEYEESKLFYLELKTMNSREILFESLEILLGAQN